MPLAGRDQFLIFGSPCIEQDEIDEIVSVLKSGWLGIGPRVALFEREFATYKGASHAAALFSCTAALQRRPQIWQGYNQVFAGLAIHAWPTRPGGNSWVF